MEINPNIMEYVVSNINIDQPSNEQISSILNKLDTYGLCVLPSVFNGEICDKYATDSINWLINLLPPLTKDPKTWIFPNLPYGNKTGLHHSLVSHSPILWTLREKLYPLFCGLWNTNELITSLDGGTIFPPNKVENKDWPHVDQTVPETKLHCFQAQVVLTDTTACFKCTPKSHLQHDMLSKKYKFDTKNQWFKFTESQISEMKNMFENWQIPIYTPKGSIILWRSTTIHSAQYVIDPNIYKNLKNTKKWLDGWRCTYYICERPKSHFTDLELNEIRQAVINGRTSNHWGTKLFPKSDPSENKDPRVNKILDNPKIVSPKNLSDLQKKLCSFINY
jgi:hypothetical protein